VTLGILDATRRMPPPRTNSFIDLAVEEMRRHLTIQLAILGPQKQQPRHKRAPAARDNPLLTL
jgi:hypothetical protein